MDTLLIFIKIEFSIRAKNTIILVHQTIEITKSFIILSELMSIASNQLGILIIMVRHKSRL